MPKLQYIPIAPYSIAIMWEHKPTLTGVNTRVDKREQEDVCQENTWWKPELEFMHPVLLSSQQEKEGYNICSRGSLKMATQTLP